MLEGTSNIEKKIFSIGRGRNFLPYDKVKGYFQGYYSPQIFNGMGYTLVSEELSDDELMKTSLLSMQYIKEFMQTILRTTYLYDEEENKTR